MAKYPKQSSSKLVHGTIWLALPVIFWGVHEKFEVIATPAAQGQVSTESTMLKNFETGKPDCKNAGSDGVASVTDSRKLLETAALTRRAVRLKGSPGSLVPVALEPSTLLL